MGDQQVVKGINDGEARGVDERVGSDVQGRKGEAGVRRDVAGSSSDVGGRERRHRGSASVGRKGRFAKELLSELNLLRKKVPSACAFLSVALRLCSVRLTHTARCSTW